MNVRLRIIVHLLTIGAVLASVGAAWAQSPADGFNPGANGTVYAIAVQPDGKILVGGAFTMLGGGGSGTVERNYIGRLNPDGSLDATFNPGANATVYDIAVQADGKILVGGQFTTMGGGGTGSTERRAVARLNPDGSLDPGFNPGKGGLVHSIVVQPDGRIVMAGLFDMYSTAGASFHHNITRVDQNGMFDDAFNPGSNDGVTDMVLQPDGKIIVVGFFTALGGGIGTTTRNHIGRINADGSLDASFDVGAGNLVEVVALQPDGKIVVGGTFGYLECPAQGTFSRSFLGRLNPDGTVDTSFDTETGNWVSALAVQSDGKILVGGYFTNMRDNGEIVDRRNIGRLNPDGSIDLAFNPGADSYVKAFGLQADGSILVGGDFFMLGGGGTGTYARKKIGRLYGNGSLDTDFNPGANSYIEPVVMQPDGKILVGGPYTVIGGGGSGSISRPYITRLNGDGSVDLGFNANAGAQVKAIAVQPDGKILVGGTFTTMNSIGRNRLARLNPDGSLDIAFNVGADNSVYAIAVQPDGKILVGGVFTTLGVGGTGTVTRNRIGRLNADGSLDTGFDPGANNTVYTFALQPDGKILVGGNFTTLGGGGTGTITRNRIGRLNANGTVDDTFNPGANSFVYSMALEPDGQILLGGGFIRLGGGTGTTDRQYIGRLNGDGTVDTFNPGANGQVSSFAVQADGKIVVGGNFTFIGGGTGTTARNRIARLNANGTVDTAFNPGADGNVTGVAIQPDGKIVVGGLFSNLGGGSGTTPRNRLGRLSATGAAIENLAVSAEGDGVTWWRSGTGPELWRVSVESSPDGIVFTPQGDAMKVSGGWQLTGLALPREQNVFVRARGFIRSGGVNGSDGIIESTRLVWLAEDSLPPAGDFTGDRRSDVLWRHDTGGDVWLWPMDGAAKVSETYVRTVADTAWEIRGQGDMNGDGKADLLWRNKLSGMIYYWPMDGTTPLAETYVATVDPAYDIVGTGDFNGDGKADLLWRHAVVGDVWVWLMNGATPLSEIYVDTVDPGYLVKGVGDVDGDLRADLVWHGVAGDVWVWLMHGTARLSQTYVGTVADTHYQIQQVADFDGNGTADLLWWNAVQGDVWIWPMDGTTVLSETYVGTVPDTQYRIQAAGDYNGDGKADLLWRHATQGDVWVWLMNGAVKLSETYVGTVPDTGYQIVRVT